ncbi:putative uncharacterized protein DDB_G0271982 [Macadamia integrifolia]|uniref:putative uncharacterized protein DDB_G0271982 n=1 Tax=Macadamia integrifolia TaxID=60698 RepID=UPI001C4F5A45|nr:putative uncharacterized protein DDB_G0271982 [Macadamia integrifolia]
MSRCFPFPPPGYEKKARTDEADILTKEKQKEKKHKKDKKEKKDKERSNDKHKEKKDRKEKHKDKKDKDKDNNKISDEKRNEGRHEGNNGEKIDQNRHQAEEIKNSKFVQELGRRIRDAEKGTGVQMLESFTVADQRKAEGMVRLVEKVVDNRSEVKEKNKVGADQKRAEVGMARLVEKDVSNRVEGKEKNKDVIVQRRAEGMAKLVENVVNWAEGKEKNKEKKNDDQKADVQRSRDEERNSGNAKNFTKMDQQRVEGMGKPMEKDAEKRLEGKEKKKSKEGSGKQGDKHKGRDREKKSKGKDKDRSKEKEKEREKEKTKEKINRKNREHDKLKDSSKDSTSTINNKTSALNLSKESDKSFDADGNLKKRKDREMNGFLHGSDIRPNKLPRPAFSSHLLTENGKKVDPCQPSIQFTSDRQGLPNNFKSENKERKVNGIIDVQPASVCSTKELPAAQANENGEGSTRPPHPTSVCSTKELPAVPANENGEASTRPPHPDLRYLSQILSVPKMEEWSEFDDQEWLFSSDSLQSKKPKVGSSVVNETPQVWAEALQIESADVCALPYVIPY